MRVSRFLSATLAVLVVTAPAFAQDPSTTPPSVITEAAPAAAPTPSADPSKPVFSTTLAVTPPPVAPAAPEATAAASPEQAPTAAPAAGAEAPTNAPAPVEAAAPPPPPEPTLSIDINLSTQRMTVSENGEARYTWAISSAAAGYRTPTGTFKPAWMARMWYSRQYDWSPMPHAIFFHRGVAIHATQAIRQLGRPASHGCVRLAPSNAATLYKMVSRHGKDMTRISVHGTPRHPAVSYRSSGPRYGYRYGQRRGPAGVAAYYGSSNAYYVPAPKRRAAPRYVPPRRYVSRGLFSPY